MATAKMTRIMDLEPKQSGETEKPNNTSEITFRVVCSNILIPESRR